MRRKKPYIGVTGFMRHDEVMFTLLNSPGNLESVNRNIMVGVLANLKTLKNIPQKKFNRYPKRNDVNWIFANHPLAFNLVHYNTKEIDTLSKQLDAITYSGGPKMHGLQLNVTWPSRDTLRKYRKKHPGKQIVLQAGKRLLKMVNHSPERLARLVSTYDEVADHVLIDASGGEGKELDPTHMEDYVRALYEQKLDMGIGVAGGLSAKTLHLVEPLIKSFPDLSIDAESRLRTRNDRLEIRMAHEYICRAVSMLQHAHR